MLSTKHSAQPDGPRCIFGTRLPNYLLVRYDGRVGREREVDPRVGHQVRLELLQVDVERPLEPERGRRGRDDLGPRYD